MTMQIKLIDMMNQSLSTKIVDYCVPFQEAMDILFSDWEVEPKVVHTASMRDAPGSTIKVRVLSFSDSYVQVDERVIYDESIAEEPEEHGILDFFEVKQVKVTRVEYREV